VAEKKAKINPEAFTSEALAEGRAEREELMRKLHPIKRIDRKHIVK
jgi:hypothetical protein